MIKIIIADKNRVKIESLVAQKPLNQAFIKAVDYFDTIDNVSEFHRNQDIKKLIVDGNDFYTYRLNSYNRMLFTVYKDEQGQINIIIIDVVTAKELYNNEYLRSLSDFT